MGKHRRRRRKQGGFGQTASKTAAATASTPLQRQNAFRNKLKWTARRNLPPAQSDEEPNEWSGSQQVLLTPARAAESFLYRFRHYRR